MLKASHIQKSYGSTTVLADISFSLAKGQKVALVGDNGIGKTTLLKIIAGIEEADGGSLQVAGTAHIGYLRQDIDLVDAETISQYLSRVVGAEIEEHRKRVMLAGFGLDSISLDHNVANLSSGQKSKIALIGILLKGVDLLLLDEPTNNLDLPALIWLEDFLRKSTASAIIVSHDRRFLDRLVKKIFELDRNTRNLNISGGTYSEYLVTVAMRLARQRLDYQAQQEEIERLKEQARQKRVAAVMGSKWKGTDNDKMLRGFKRDRAERSGRVAKTLEKRIEQMEKVDKPNERDPLEIPLESNDSPGMLDIRLIDVVAGYRDGFYAGPMSLDIRFGNRVGIMGLNGSGKSTVLKTITGMLPALGGKVEIGSGVKLGNMMQEHESLPRNETLYEFLIKRGELSEEMTFATLRKYGFAERQIRQRIDTLSPGGRARLLLALFSVQSVNVLVLDEPTNHLDLEALEALEETLKTYTGTVILVSHDRYFLETAQLDTTYLLSEGNLTKIPDYGTYMADAELRAQKLLRMI